MKQQINTLLIALLMSFSVSSQTDSLLCFTQGQVKTFLLTKTELINCLDEYNAMSIDLNTIQETNRNLTIDYNKLEIKAVKRKKIAIISTVVAIAEAGILYILIK